MSFKISKDGKLLPKNETAIQNDICDFLKWYQNSIKCWRQPNVATWDSKRKIYVWDNNRLKGVFDIIGWFLVDYEFNGNLWLKGKPFAVDPKYPGNKLSDDQLTFQSDVRSVGGFAEAAYCIDDIEKLLGPPGYNQKKP